VRLRFAVQNAEEAGASWGVEIKNAAGQTAWSIWAGEVDGGSFWSDEVEGANVKVEVYSARPANPVRLRIDKVAVRTNEAKPLSITGDRNHMKSIRGQDRWIVGCGRSVVRLRFVADTGGWYSCTAFLVTRDLALTNQHCISSISEMKSAEVDFDFDAEAAKYTTTRLRELVQTSVDLDYSLVRLQKAVDRTPLRLEPTPLPEREQLLVIQHPGGASKQISLRDCRLEGVSVAAKRPGTDFGHQCDTVTGSSGSPVFRFASKTVVGLHHLGYDGASLFNRAVYIGQVLADLPPDRRAEIEAGQLPP
jgi:trypsin-like peptidase